MNKIDVNKLGGIMVNFERHSLYQRYKLIVNSAFLVTLASVLFVYPFNNHFRFTLGVVVLATLLLYFPKLPVVSTAVLSGMGIFITRIAIDCFISSYDLLTAAYYALPAFVYYLFFGLGLYVLHVRNSIRDVPVIFLKLILIDLFSNFAEISIRNELRLGDSITILPTLAGVAILRTIGTIYSYYCLRRYKDVILAEERSIRYTQLTLVFAKIKAELYFLQKSSQEIERVMERSYALYQNLSAGRPASVDETVGREALTIAREIHEIKKDYYRVIDGIKNIVAPSDSEGGMSLSEIFYIIGQNTSRYIKLNDLKVNIVFQRQDDFITNKHYTLVSILDNLIINAIEACNEDGMIKVTESRLDNMVTFCVEDNGVGIRAGDLELIYNPGYSTKYSAVTGKLSTGLGLVHVKNLTEALGGTVAVFSKPGELTEFFVTIPYSGLIEF